MEKSFLVQTAYKAQKIISKRILKKPLNKPLQKIGALDVAYSRKGFSVGVAVVGDYKTHRIIEKKIVLTRPYFPYIPGLLAFREIQPMMAAYNALKVKPDALLVDGHGYMHPRKAGIASHIGVVLGIPVIGVAKKRLVGEIRHYPDASRIFYEGELVGFLLEEPPDARKLFISVGSHITLDQAFRIVRSLRKERGLPFPLDIADRLSRRVARRIA